MARPARPSRSAKPEPDDTKRRELMIIYGEILAGDASEERVKAEITAHAQAGMKMP